MTNTTSSMPQVYAIFAEESGCYYSHPELVKLFAIEAEAETFAQTLREMTSESCWEGEEPEPKYIQVEVKALTIS